MATGVQNEVASFAYHLRSVALLAKRAQKSEELKAELASRGIERHELEELAEKVDDMTQHFYDEPRPV